MLKLEIIKAGLLTTIQDMGRPGLAYYAIPAAGAMDKNAARIAQLLLNQAEDHPLIECTSVAPTLKFHGATDIAITGADFHWTLNDAPVPRNTILSVQAGDTLAGKMATQGFRGYLALGGKLKLEKIYQSYATHLNAGIGGYQGRVLKKGDVLAWENPKVPFAGKGEIPILPGPEFTWLTSASQQRLRDITYTVGNDSNRMGLRLRGQPLESSGYQLPHSLPVLPGFIQLPPSGLPIIILQDGQVSGGYPRIAYLEDQLLTKLNQVPLGAQVRLRLT